MKKHILRLSSLMKRTLLRFLKINRDRAIRIGNAIGVIVLVALVVPSSSAAPAENRTAKLVGQVVDQEGESIAGAEIKIHELNLTTLTDEQGNFAFENLPPGSVTVEATADGYFPSYPTSVDLTSDPEKAMEIQLARLFVVEETVVVTGTRKEDYISRAPVRTEVVQQELCARKASRNLAEALTTTVTGIRVEAQCQNCGFTTVRLNGLEGKYTQILEDGLPTLSGVAMVYGLEQIPTEFFEQIEVVKGGASALYGPNAVAGVINLVRREPTQNLFKFDGQAGWHKDRPAQSVSFHGQLEKIPGNFAADFYFRANNQTAVDRNDDGFSDAPKRRSNGGGFTFYRRFLDEDARLSFGGTALNEFRRGGDRLDLPPEQTYITEQAQSDRFTAFLRWNHTVSPSTYYTLATHLSYLERDTYYGSHFDPNAYGRTRNPLWNSDLSFGRQLGEHFLLGGFQYQREHVSDHIVAYQRAFDETFTNAGFYLQDQFSVIPRVTLVGGFRIDKANTLDHPVLSPRGNVRVGLSDNFNLRVGISTGFRSPVIFDEDLHITQVGGEGMVIQNSPGLKEEKSWSFTGALDYLGLVRGLPLQFGVSFFHTRLNDVHVLEETDEFASGFRQLLRINAKGSYVRGVEFDWNWQIHRRVNVRGGSSFQVSRLDEPEPQFGSRRYFHTPNRYGFVGLDMDLPIGFELLSTLDITGSMEVPHYKGFIAEDRLEKTEIFKTWNVVVGRTFDTGRGPMRLYVVLDNLLDDYQNDLDMGSLRDSGYVYGPMSMRSVRVGMSMQF